MKVLLPLSSMPVFAGPEDARRPADLPPAEASRVEAVKIRTIHRRGTRSRIALRPRTYRRVICYARTEPDGPWLGWRYEPAAEGSAP